MDIALIVAMAENGVIGRNNQLPWYLPEDLKYFKKVTLGKPVIMGRKTYDSIGKPLPGRTNIVISRQQDLGYPDSVKVVDSVDAAVRLAQSIGLIDGVDEMMVIGGEQIYQAFIDRADRLYLTRVHAEVEGDARFSAYKSNAWQQVAEEKHPASGSNPYDYSFCVLERKA